MILAAVCIVYFVGALSTICLLSFAYGAGWFWARPLWQRLALMVSLVVSAVVAVGSFSARDEATEATFDAVTDHVWPAVPLAVAWDSRDLDGYTEALEGAMGTWNHAVGCPLFTRAMVAEVRVVSADGTPCGREGVDLHGSDKEDTPGATWSCQDGTREIQVHALGEVSTTYRVFLHELGHVLGLAHDRPGEGIMAPAILPMSVIEPNAKDAAALRERYCR